MTNLPSAFVKSAFDVAARVRHARVLYPVGIRLSGRLHAETRYESLFGAGERAVIARLSKATGTPAGVPDVLGLAFRVLDRNNQPWDFTLTTTGTGFIGRFVITVARGWDSARYGALLPYRLGDSGLTWVFAEPDASQPDTASLKAMIRHLHDHQITFELTARGTDGGQDKIGELTLHRADTADYRTDFFDPMLNHPEGVVLMPAALSKIREMSYLGSRRGRGEVT
ncbi:phosphodiesterase [Nocardia sp. NPDC050710]|uniref:phosphodiesterase n=1 Tax=Nocardia sp. NPDC050710 TaxID=3157220 RepID=UPI0034063B3D